MDSSTSKDLLVYRSLSTRSQPYSIQIKLCCGVVNHSMLKGNHVIEETVWLIDFTITNKGQSKPWTRQSKALYVKRLILVNSLL